MGFFDLLRDAVGNTFRNKVRTALTVIAIFIGAFTLTITNSIGTGVSSYINNQINSIGSPTIISVQQPLPDAADRADGPEVYDPDKVVNSDAPQGLSIDFLTDSDVEKLRELPNVDKVEPTILVSPNYIQHGDGEQYVVNVNIAAAVMTPDLSAGKAFSDGGDALEVILPPSYVEALGFDTDREAVGETVSFGIKDFTGTNHVVEATVVGIQNKSLFGETVSLNQALTTELSALQKEGIPVQSDNSYISAIVSFSDELSQEEIDTLVADISDAGYEGTTIAEQLGSIQAVINGIIGILNAFAGIALLAAGFGIVNTLLMSVQERTREIGLMKAMGMGRGKIYTLFSLEAVFIGFLGSAIGSAVAIAVGSAISASLSASGGLLADLPGLTLMEFTVGSTLVVMAIVMAIAFLAGTIPASRAAKQNPIDALRYE